MNFSREEWEKFIAAVVEFAAEEMKPNVEFRPLDAALSRPVAPGTEG